MSFNTLKMTMIATSIMFSGCASKSVSPANASGDTKKGASQIDDLDKGPKNSDQTKTDTTKTVEKDCSDFQSTSVLKKYSLDLGGDIVDLCDIMQKKSAQTTVVMITSPTCLSCKPVMKKINTYLQGQSNIEFVVAVPNRHDDVEAYSISDIQKMTDEYAKGAIPAFDMDAKMWMSLSENSQSPVFPVVLVINNNARGKVIHTSDLEKPNVVDDLVIPTIEKYSK